MVRGCPSSPGPREEAAQEGAEHGSALPAPLQAALSNSRACAGRGCALGAVPPPRPAWGCAPGASGCVQALLCPAPCSWAAVREQAAAQLSCPGLSTDPSPVPTPVSLPSPQCSRRGQTRSICPATTVLDVPGQLDCRQPSGRRSSLPAELPFNKWLWRWVPGAVGVLVPCCAASPAAPRDAAGSPPQQAGGPR